MALFSPMAELNKHASHSSKVCNWAVPYRQETSLNTVFIIRGIGGPLVARGDHLQQLYLVQPDRLRQGTTCGMT